MQILTFQQAFSKLNNLSNLSTIFPSYSQVSGKFPTLLFHSFVVKSNIFSCNSCIMVASSTQVLINFPAQYCFHSEIQCLLQQFQHSSLKYYSSLSTFSIVLFYSFNRKSNIFSSTINSYKISIHTFSIFIIRDCQDN